MNFLKKPKNFENPSFNNNLIHLNSNFNLYDSNLRINPRKNSDCFKNEFILNSSGLEFNSEQKNNLISNNMINTIFNYLPVDVNDEDNKSEDNEKVYFHYKEENIINNSLQKIKESSPVNIDSSSKKNEKSITKVKFTINKCKEERKYKEYNIRSKITRKFLNSYLIKNINMAFKDVNSQISFEKFPKSFTNDASKKSNKKILSMTLEQLLVTKELYKGNDTKRNLHNIKSLNEIKSENYNNIRKTNRIEFILNSNFCDLFSDYLSSDEFRKEINSLKNDNKMYNNDYIERYKYYSEHFIQNYKD